MDAKFGGDNQEHMLITCRVTNTVLEPFFALPPVSFFLLLICFGLFIYTPHVDKWLLLQGEMRKLSKTDKTRSADLIRDGGKAVQHQIHNMATYIVTVVPMLNENATIARPTVVDGPLPILQVLRVA
jgi:hypothetical protein